MRFSALDGGLVASVFSLSLLVASCASDPVSGPRGGSAAGSGAGAFSNPVAGAGAGTPTAGSFGNGSGMAGTSVIGGFAGTSAGASAGTTGACGGDTYAAETRPLDIYVIMDESASMIFPVDIWGPTSMALNQFFASPDTAGISAGIAFFSGGCDIAAYRTPVVAVAELPGNAAMLQMALAARLPGPGTATEPALRGAIAFAHQRAIDNPDRKQIVLLVTDGEPASCNATVESTSVAAAEGVSGTPSIPTYVLGLGNVAGLNQMAAAGGTNSAFVVSDATQVQAVVDAINQIRGQALPCEYRVPTSTGSFDKNLVNLNWTRGGTTTSIPFVNDAAACAGVATGWHYDNIDAPTQLIACDQTCNELKVGGGDISVALGCPTIRPE